MNWLFFWRASLGIIVFQRRAGAIGVYPTERRQQRPFLRALFPRFFLILAAQGWDLLLPVTRRF